MNEEPVTAAIVIRGPLVPILSDPEVRAALETLARATLEDIATQYHPVLARARSLASEAECIPVTSQAECEFLQDWLATQVGTTEEQAKGIVDPYARFAHRLHTAFTGLRALVTTETEKARAIAKPKILEWGRTVERMRLDAERRAREEREAAELKLAIARSPYLGHVGIAQFAEISENEREKQEAADRARAAGDHEVADALADEIGKVEAPTIQPTLGLSAVPLVAPPAAAVPAAPKGIADNWKARLVPAADTEAALLRVARSVVAHPEHVGVLALDQSGADKAAKLYKDKLGNVIDGLEGFNDQNVRAKPRRGR